MQLSGLVLSRYTDEQVVVDLRAHGLGLIHVGVVAIKHGSQGQKVKLLFDCDDGIPVHRKEVFDAIEKERGAA